MFYGEKENTMRKLILISFTLIWVLSAQNTETDKLVKGLLGDTQIEEDLKELCDVIGGRPTGSKANILSINWGLEKFKEAGVRVRKEAFTMPGLWLENESSAHISGATEFEPRVVALTFSKGTPRTGLRGKLVDGGHGTIDDFAKLGENAKGNFVLIETNELLDIDGLFKEYADAVLIEDLAYDAGVKGLVYMSSRPMRLLYRHNASRSFENTLPMVVMAREDAKRCLRVLRKDASLSILVKINVRKGGPYKSYNVIGEIKGSERPDEVVIIGAHLDSWGLGTGANDNGCNVAMMIDIARQMVKLEIKPKRTIRFALWNGEELGLFGSMAYTKENDSELDNHVMAMSIDIGSGPITGFFTGGRSDVLNVTNKILDPLTDLGVFTNIDIPLVGTDNFDFMMHGVGNLIANHDPANYAPNYHAESDTYDKVNLEALKRNSAIIAAVTLEYANDLNINIPRQSRQDIEKLVESTDLEQQMKSMMGIWYQWIDGKRGR